MVLFPDWHWPSFCYSLNAITVSEEKIQLRFDGPELREHRMDVALLGTSLVALGDLCVEANAILNGENAKVRVLITADVKANCVTLDLSVIQNVITHIQTLLASTDIATARELLGWIGILKTTGVAAGYKLLQYLNWRKDNKGREIQIKQGENGNSVVISVVGNHNTIIVPTPIYKLSKSPKLVESIKQLASPVSETNGINEAVFIYNKQEHLKIDKALAENIKGLQADAGDPGPQIFTVRIVVHSPVLDTKSKHWKFKFNGHVQTVDIGQTTIAQDAIARGGINVGHTYTVKMEMEERTTKAGCFATDFTILEVLDFKPGQRATQNTML
jgi:hypothetical protein